MIFPLTAPLEWPDWYQYPGFIGAFLKDVPVFGLDARCKRHLNWKLSERDTLQWELEWSPYSMERSVTLMISPVIGKWMRWCNTWFIPKDPCSILFWDPRFHLDAVQAMLEISQSLEVPDNAFNNLETLTYIDFIRRITAIEKRVQEHFEENSGEDGCGRKRGNGDIQNSFSRKS